MGSGRRVTAAAAARRLMVEATADTVAGRIARRLEEEGILRVAAGIREEHRISQEAAVRAGAGILVAAIRVGAVGTPAAEGITAKRIGFGRVDVTGRKNRGEGGRANRHALSFMGSFDQLEGSALAKATPEGAR